MKKLNYIKLFENFSNEDWKETFPGYEGYQLMVNDDKLEEIKNALSLEDKDIKVSYGEMQEDRSQTFLSVLVNVNALSEDKKASWKDTIKDILGVSDKDVTKDLPKDIAEKKPNILKRLFKK